MALHQGWESPFKLLLSLHQDPFRVVSFRFASLPNKSEKNSSKSKTNRKNIHYLKMSLLLFVASIRHEFFRHLDRKMSNKSQNVSLLLQYVQNFFVASMFACACLLACASASSRPAVRPPAMFAFSHAIVKHMLTLLHQQRRHFRGI